MRGDVAALVEGVEGIAGPGDVAGDQACRPEHILGGDVGTAVEFADRHAAFVQVVGAAPGVVLLPRPKADHAVDVTNS